MKLTSQDRAFIERALRAELLEVESSRIAIRRIAPGALRSFANRMQAEHASDSRELRSIAKSHAMPISRDLDSGHPSEIGELDRLTGDGFDARYLGLQIEAHDAVIELFEAAKRECYNLELRAFVAETLPRLRGRRARLDAIHAPSMPELLLRS